MKIELPENFSLPVDAGDGTKRKPSPVSLGFTGHVVIPDTWTLGDYQEQYEAATGIGKEDNVWMLMWQWAEKRIVEWAIDGLSTNPRQIKLDDMTWVLMSFLANSVINGMNSYVEDEAALLETKEQIEFPTPETLRPSEFMAWHKAQREYAGEKGVNKCLLLKGWFAGKELVRKWPKGVNPDKWQDVDLRVAFAVDELLAEAILPAMNLGNWSARLGEA